MAHYFVIDGCKGGWITVGLSRSEDWIVSAFADINVLWSALRGAKLFLIDIPIGLCDGEVKSRACDIAARRLLGSPRASSVHSACASCIGFR
jgi:predicted RNase H-like nuclease